MKTKQLNGQIRPACADDLQIVRDITRQTIEAVYPHYYPAGAVAFFLQHHNDEAIRQDIAENHVYLYISDDGQAAGTVTVKENDIGRLFVLPAYQGHGYGGALIAFAEQLIAAQYPEAVLDASFAAKALYLRHGWQERRKIRQRVRLAGDMRERSFKMKMICINCPKGCELDVKPVKRWKTGYHLIACENGDFLCHDTMKKRLRPAEKQKQGGQKHDT